MAKYRRIKEHETFQENPFIEKAIDEIDIIKKTQVIRGKDKSELKLIVDDKSGEVEGHNVFMRFIEVDEDKFTKIYLSQFAAFWDLPKTSIKVFGYIMSALIPNKDWFLFDKDECIKYTTYSTEKSIFDGLGGLIEAGIIARSNNPYKYFINPLVVFNGSRVTFAKTYVKKRKEQKDKEIGINKQQLNLF